MPWTTRLRSGVFLLLAIVCLIASSAPLAAQSDTLHVGEYTLSGPYTHDNLSVYLVHGKDKIKTKNMLTLAEAMRRKKIRVYETGNVNELQVENISSTQSIFIQAGEIVKGGRQDRTLGIDLVLAPRSGRVPIAAYCVESGRWSRRGGESAQEFSSSEEQLVSRDLKLAARYNKDQSKVWANVKQSQDKLSEKVGERVNANESSSSLQLSLENDRLRKKIDEYVDGLRRLGVGNQNVVGCIFAINGDMNGAEVYASNDLFARSWPKLLRAASIEAVAEIDTVWTPTVAPVSAAKEFIAPASGEGTASTQNIDANNQVITHDRDDAVAIESRANETTVRKSWIRK